MIGSFFDRVMGFRGGFGTGIRGSAGRVWSAARNGLARRNPPPPADSGIDRFGRHNNGAELQTLLEILEDRYGHRDTFVKKVPVDREGKPLPWYTYPAIDYLRQLDLSWCRVFEYGCGNGSLFFASRARQVVSVEDNRKWHARVCRDKPANLDVLLREDGRNYVEAVKEPGGSFDVIVIDGADRRQCAAVAFEHLAPGGMIILDNSDWYPHTAADLRRQGLLQIDFHGFGPVNYFTWTTSLLMRRDAAFEPATGVQPVTPIGGQHDAIDGTADDRLRSGRPSAADGDRHRHSGSIYGAWTYAYEGEDLLLRRYLADRKPGFYVDVGACHPVRFSNTHAFYCHGWRGINIDATPGSMAAFREFRPHDINLEMGVHRDAGNLEYFQFAEPALNTFCPQLADHYARAGHSIVRKNQIPTLPLAEILAQHVPDGTKIDFLTVDVEGSEAEVLASNDWARFRPDFVLVEDLNVKTLDDVACSPSAALLKAHGYRPIAKSLTTIFFAAHDQ